MPAKVILVGIEGFGRIHLENQRRLRGLGRTQLTALVDPVVKRRLDTDPTTVVPDDAPLCASLSDALSLAGVPDIVIVSTPIHLHASIAKEALEAGADVYLEKPPFACMSDFDSLLETQKRTGKAVQVGFQSLGSAALPAFDSGEMKIGKIRAVRATGFWLRKKAYWERSPWVGKRSIDNVWVMDGVATNALSHAVITALRIAGASTVDQVADVEVETYRANPIDADDTTSIKIKLKDGPKVTAALTLCADAQLPPVIEVVGEHGTALFQYTTDDVQLTITGEGKPKRYTRTDLTENLLDHREKGTPLLVSLELTGAYMRVLEALRLRGEPVHVERKWITVHGEGTDSNPVIKDVNQWMQKAVEADDLVSAVGTPWAFSQRDAEIFRGSVQGRDIFRILDGAGTTPSSSPRPYIHPITTLSGVEVTATRPSDHDWHMGCSFAVPDVDGVTYWGGGTYVHGRGYVLLDNYGTQTTEEMTSTDTSLDQVLLWRNPEQVTQIREHRHLEWSPLEVPGGSLSGWELLFQSSLTAANGAISLGSPGTNGRVNAGYGGFNWRLPRCTNIDVMSSDADGEDAVHGSKASWIAWSARFQAKPGACGDATVIMIANDPMSAQDPWIVRQTAYPGLGSGVAWYKRVNIPAQETIRRAFRIAIMDGKLDREACAAVGKAMEARKGK